MPVKFVFNIPQLSTWMLLHQTHDSIAKCEDKVFAKIDMTTQQHGILMAIKNIGAPATPTQIADFVDRNLNTVTLIVERMEKNGLLTRVRDMQDRRSFRLVITEKGEEYIKKSSVTSASLVKKVLGSLSEDELRTLSSLLEKVRLEAIQHCQKDISLKEVVINTDPQMLQAFQDNPGK